MRLYLLLFICLFFFKGCVSQNYKGPGNDFDLFEGTKNESLAKAINREDTLLANDILNDKSINIDLQESKFGNSLLMLAIVHDKLTSVQFLLNKGANLNLIDSSNEQAIHIASEGVREQNTCTIIELLISHGANINTAYHGKGIDSNYYYVPLMGAVNNIQCAKLLLKNGANIYYKHKDTYCVWLEILSNLNKEKVSFLRYLLIEQKMNIPENITHKLNGTPLTAIELLNNPEFDSNSEFRKIRDELLSSIQINGFYSK
jgi:ankyrin repeat protein